MQQIRVIDSHTAGEPTRLVLEGGPPLGPGPLDERAAAIPRPSSTPSVRRSSTSRAARTPWSARCCARRIAPIAASASSSSTTSAFSACAATAPSGWSPRWRTAASSRPGACASTRRWARWTRSCTPTARVASTTCLATARRAGVAVDVPGVGVVRGDVAWGGNWFFLVREHGLDIDLRECRGAHRVHLARAPGAECAGTSRSRSRRVVRPVAGRPAPHSRNFVLCPGKAYDRSPCGTAPARNSPASRPMASSPKARSGSRRASSAASFSGAAIAGSTARGRDRAHHDRPRARERAGHAAAGSRGSVLLGNPLSRPLRRSRRTQRTENQQNAATSAMASSGASSASKRDDRGGDHFDGRHHRIAEARGERRRLGAHQRGHALRDGRRRRRPQ